MNSLPPELHLMIFKLLPVKDTIRLQLVSKEWYRLLNSLKHQQLTIVGENEPPNHLEIKPFHRVNCIVDDLLIRPMPPLLRSVRKLTTYFFFVQNIDLSRFYNQFNELEELYFYVSRWVPVCNTILNLQHLNKLKIECDNGSLFDLRTPRLTHLWVEKLSNCSLYFPDRLRQLETSYFFIKEVDLWEFKNLEFLRLMGDCWSTITNSLLIKLSNLKELHLTGVIFPNRDTLNSFFNYRRAGLRIYLLGFDIDQNVQEVENFLRCDAKSVSKFIVGNYEKPAEKACHWDELCVEYNELIKGGLKKNFLVKFPRLRGVELIDKVEDEKALLEFLMKTQPENFSMENVLLSQEILSQIALYCEIRELELKLDLDVMCPEFDFIYKMESLNEVRVHQSISVDFLLKVFQMCKKMMEVHFEIVDYRDLATFKRYEVRMFSRVLADQINRNYESLNAFLYFDSDPAFFHFLRSLRKEQQLSCKPNDLRKMIFLINDFKHNEILVAREVKRLFKNEVLYIHNKPF